MKPDRAPLTPAERQQRRRDKIKEEGLEGILIVVPRTRVDEIRGIAADWVAKFQRTKK